MIISVSSVVVVIVFFLFLEPLALDFQIPGTCRRNTRREGGWPGPKRCKK